MGGPAGIERAKQLLVEARDAEVFVHAFMDRLGIQDVQVQDNPAIECVDAYFTCLRNGGLPPPSHPEKARAHAFLASREVPDILVGQAAWKGYWRFDHGSMENLRSFLLSI